MVTALQQLAHLFEICHEAVVGVAADGTIVSWNAGAVALYGWAPAEAVGRSIDLLEREPGPALARLRSGPCARVEVRRRRKDGMERIVLLSGAPFAVGEGPPSCFVEASLDITEHKQLQEALEHGERLAQIGRIAASMAHEINNPLAVINASVFRVAQLASDVGNAELAECAADATLAAERIGGFVKHICGFARRERPVLADMPIRSTIEMALKFVRPRALERNVIVFFERGPDLPVRQDLPRLGQAFVNLVANAIDAAALGGRTVAVRVVPAPASVSVEVDDDGPGIAPEIRDHLFEAFASTKPPGEGTGLGLSITRRIVEQHEGRVALLPRPEGGTRAVVTLPFLQLSSFLILVAEPDPAVRRALATDISRGGFRVRVASTVREARDLLDGTEIHAVVAEARFADGPVISLFEELRTLRPAVGRALITGSSLGPDSPEGRLAHMLLDKPWSQEQLLAALRRLCADRWPG